MVGNTNLEFENFSAATANTLACQLVPIGVNWCCQLVPPNDCRKLSQVRKRNSSWHELEIRRKSGHYLAESEVPGKVGAERQTADRGKENRNRWKQLCFPNRVC